MTEGYLSGRLSYKETNKFSKLREEYILSVIEKKKLESISELRSVVFAVMADRNVEFGRQALAILNQYEEYALPYLHKEDKMKVKDPKTFSKEEIEKWKKTLTDAKEAIAKHERENG